MTLSPRSLKHLCFITKIKTYLQESQELTIIYSDAKLTSATALRTDKLNPPYYDYVIGLAN